MIDHALHFLTDQFQWRNDQDLLDDLVSGKASRLLEYLQGDVLRLAILIQAVAETIRHDSNPHIDLKASDK